MVQFKEEEEDVEESPPSTKTLLARSQLGSARRQADRAMATSLPAAPLLARPRRMPGAPPLAFHPLHRRRCSECMRDRSSIRFAASGTVVLHLLTCTRWCSSSVRGHGEIRPRAPRGACSASSASGSAPRRRRRRCRAPCRCASRTSRTRPATDTSTSGFHCCD
ncbi:uncharacterized protein LOC112882295 isoform X1 [Panicum hallii]|uniref:uncharacterized protein LOC112882295 isoform X1 n=1 Tax=Panicum hallii TaxID=206008 RepID=UPI000DF4CCA7|nr:uncharacterized protein LOC112882295 isoform X1 [Panicum hallii]